MFVPSSGESGIRTHAPLRTNGFQDRLVMTTSISLQVFRRFNGKDYSNKYKAHCQQDFSSFFVTFWEHPKYGFHRHFIPFDDRIYLQYRYLPVSLF